MTDEEIKQLCDKLADLLIKAPNEHHERYIAVTKIYALIKKLKKNEKPADT